MTGFVVLVTVALGVGFAFIVDPKGALALKVAFVLVGICFAVCLGFLIAKVGA